MTANPAVPTIGRIVHYVEHGRCIAAIVTDASAHEAKLTIFRPEAPSSPVGHGFWIHHDEEPRDEGTWHWPERVPEHPAVAAPQPTSPPGTIQRPVRSPDSSIGGAP